MMTNVEPQFIIYGEDGLYAYRVRPHPDFDCSLTGEFGLLLEFSEDGGKTWIRPMFIGPKEIESLGIILLKFRRGTLE